VSLLENIADRVEAERALDALDAEIMRHYIYDGFLSAHPLDGGYDRGRRQEFRERRLVAVRALEAAGGRDPHPSIMREPTPEQRARFEQKRHGIRGD
jgi:hypothetical protein